MKGTLVKSIKVFRIDMLYDIEKPCRFDNVPALINYYSRVSLKEYNHNLDLVLIYGVSKYKFGRTTEWSLVRLYSAFRESFQQHEKWTKKFDGLEADISHIRDDLSQKRLADQALDKIIVMYDEQVKQCDKTLADNLLKKTSALSSTRLLASVLLPTTSHSSSSNDELNEDEAKQIEAIINENKTKVKSRIHGLALKKDELKLDIDYLQTILSQLQEELDLMRPELIELRKTRKLPHVAGAARRKRRQYPKCPQVRRANVAGRTTTTTKQFFGRLFYRR
jgi:uncharacterized protein YajQ (UPF0234 family)